MKQMNLVLVSLVISCVAGQAHALTIKDREKLADITRNFCNSELKDGFTQHRVKMANGDIAIEIVGPDGEAQKNAFVLNADGEFVIQDKATGARRELLPHQQEAAEIRFHTCLNKWYERHLNDLAAEKKN